MKWKRKGYLTVEGSFILGMSIIITGWMLSLCFHTFQRCWYTQAACETVLTGSFGGVLKGTEAEEKAAGKWEQRKDDFYLTPARLTVQALGDRERIEYRIFAETKAWGKNPFDFKISVFQKVIRPVTFIRKLETVVGGGK